LHPKKGGPTGGNLSKSRSCGSLVPCLRSPRKSHLSLGQVAHPDIPCLMRHLCMAKRVWCTRSWGPPLHQMSAPCPCCSKSADIDPAVFGSPSLLKQKADQITNDMPPSSPISLLPPPPSSPHKHPHCKLRVLDWTG